MFCNACGRNISEDAMFCTYCGVRVGAPATAAAPRGPGLLYRLERPRTGRWIAGVCAAVAHGLDMNVAVVRVLWLFLTILGAGFPGFIAYIVCWIVIPEQQFVLLAAPMPPAPSAPSAGSAPNGYTPVNG